MLNKNFRATTEHPLIIAVSGGSGSGKTTFAKGLKKCFGEEYVGVLSQDSYYLDLSRLFDRDGGRVNFDHPSSLDFSLLAQHLRTLKHGEPVEVPIYDFTTHSRRPASLMFQPRPVIVVEGILLLSQPEVMQFVDYSVFVDTPEAVRFARRLERDVRERGRSPEGVREQFEKQVKPMHDEFVEPSKVVASRIISGESPFEPIYRELASRIEFADRAGSHLKLQEM